MKTLITALSAADARELLQAAGFRAELLKGDTKNPIIHSASSGVNFEIRLFGPDPARLQHYRDVTFMAGLQVQGRLDPDMLNTWNEVKRFGRLYVRPGWLILVMDVALMGGVPREFLLAQINLWDRLVQELLIFLRTFSIGQQAKAPSGGKSLGAAKAAASMPGAGQPGAGAADAAASEPAADPDTVPELDETPGDPARANGHVPVPGMGAAGSAAEAEDGAARNLQ